MSKVPSLSYKKILAALERDGWIVVRQRGSHIRLEKKIPDETLKITVSCYAFKLGFICSLFPVPCSLSENLDTQLK